VIVADRIRIATALGVLTAATALAVGAAPAAGLRPLRPLAAGGHAFLAPPQARMGHVGSSNVTTADMPVPVPDTTPCVVPLFHKLDFEDFNPKPFQFTPPAACPGPWAKVVLYVDLAVTAGIQFDRTATIGLAGSTIFFGTTAEPNPNLAPSWHVSRDLTDLTALFKNAQTGQVSIDNVVSPPYTGIIIGSARLAFYPPDRRFPAPLVPDAVVPLADSNGNPVPLSTSSAQLATSFTPPTNVTRAYLDVMAQGQSTDEFWYTCFPNNLAGPLGNCGSSAFRETEVAVDGRPAGVAPVYPWIFTGGIDPFLWQPTPGVQTLNFTPYRVNLTPFAGTLDNGAVHQVALSVFNADNYFAATANLLLFLDHTAKGPLTGAVDSDTLAATPPEPIQEIGNFSPHGSIDTNSHRSFVISGHVSSAHGTIKTVVSETIDFHQHQAILDSATQFLQKIQQDSRVASQTTRSGNEPGSGTYQAAYDFPFALVYDYDVAKDGSATQTTTVSQGYVNSFVHLGAHGLPVTSELTDSVSPTDELHFDSSGNFTGNTNASNTQIYRYGNSKGDCYGKKVTSANNVVTAITKVKC
jgi:hypothetical protein